METEDQFDDEYNVVLDLVPGVPVFAQESQKLSCVADSISAVPDVPVSAQESRKLFCVADLISAVPDVPISAQESRKLFCVATIHAVVLLILFTVFKVYHY